MVVLFSFFLFFPSLSLSLSLTLTLTLSYFFYFLSFLFRPGRGLGWWSRDILVRGQRVDPKLFFPSPVANPYTPATKNMHHTIPATKRILAKWRSTTVNIIPRDTPPISYYLIPAVSGTKLQG
ncbi:hypothetical protein P167DRAFT_72082 [Morchella conica CCBAS932]|uniref:Uncharacterized protein n=1 Tax=Morchella conica CCBAS932 TaxID=1392247 RepID=A0A3N4K7Z3_9PEZI|nr:hypothetical protein P167DRAFT_72082 [Morchella conica CCBAS932]